MNMVMVLEGTAWPELVIGFVGGLAASVLGVMLTSALSWKSEIRRKGFDAYKAAYLAADAAVLQINRFIANVGGLARAEAKLGNDSDANTRDWILRTRKKIDQLNDAINECAVYMHEPELEVWRAFSGDLWNIYIDSNEKGAHNRIEEKYKDVREMRERIKGRFVNRDSVYRHIFNMEDGSE